MGIIKHLKSLLPVPRKWTDEEKAFALRLEDAYREFQLFQRTTQTFINTDRFYFPSTATWEDIWRDISKLKNGETATVFLHGNAMSIISDGARDGVLIGTIGRTSDSQFRFEGRYGTNNEFIVGRFYGTDETGPGTYSELDVTGRMTGFNSNHNSSSSKYTDLDDVEIGLWGRNMFDASVSPTGSNLSANYISIGNGAEQRTLILFTASGAYFNTRTSNGWQGWNTFTLT